MKNSLSVVRHLLIFSIASAAISTTVYATNGMNMEGYGPISTGMGGASMAYDNGAAAMMNNPATLGLMPEGNRLDVALGYLGPQVTAVCEAGPCAGESAASSSKSFYMPALGWTEKSGQFSYGLGMFGQGGMAADFSADSFMAAGSGEKVRSEVSIGRLLVPFTYAVDEAFSIGATVDYVWAGIDLKMAMSGAQFADLASPLLQQNGTATGPLVNSFMTFMGNGLIVNNARFDFSDNSAYTGAAKGTGFAGKVGGVYKINEVLTVGAAYHSKTSLNDLATNKAKVSMNVDATAFGMPASVPMVLQGKIQVKDFEWPQTAGIGVAYKVSPHLLIVADYKWTNWADVMKNFKMTFTPDQSASNDFTAVFGPGADLRGQAMDAMLYQKWKDQHVIMIGAGYNVNADWTLRIGLNYADNPVPDTYLNALFPAIVKTHLTLGAGYLVSTASTVDASFTYAPEVKQLSGSSVTSTHGQTNGQVMYSYRF